MLMWPAPAPLLQDVKRTNVRARENLCAAGIKPSAEPGWLISSRRLKQSMADEEKKSSSEQPTTDGAKAQKPKSDMMMYIIVGVGALVVTVGVMLGLMSGEHPKSAEVEDSSEESAEHSDAHGSEDAEQETPDIFSELDDLSFLADTQFADPTEEADNSDGHDSDVKKRSGSRRKSANSNVSVTASDSVEAMTWIEAEKKKITARNKALDEKAKRLEALERAVNQKLTKVDQAEAARLSGLAKLYNGMKPEQVARMLVKLNDKTIVAILPRMKSAQAAKILGLLPASRGARISQEMITLSGK
jgi:flagellar motility protein MotE (MotC chaperone)